MRRTLLAGFVLALVAALLVDHGGSDVARAAVLGGALGGALGVVADRSPVGRAIAFTFGFAMAWVGYLLRAGFLPDIPMGRALAAFIVVALVTAAAALTRNALPLWAGLLGVAAMYGAYETAYTTAPTEVLRQSPAASTAVLLAAAFGFLATVPFGRSEAPAPKVIDLREPPTDDHIDITTKSEPAHRSTPDITLNPATEA
jgi:hypothetical protein